MVSELNDFLKATVQLDNLNFGFLTSNLKSLAFYLDQTKMKNKGSVKFIANFQCKTIEYLVTFILLQRIIWKHQFLKSNK